jgi:hypothetical protein
VCRRARERSLRKKKTGNALSAVRWCGLFVRGRPPRIESGPNLAASSIDVAFGHMTCTWDFALIFSGKNPHAPEARRRTTMNRKIANKAGGKFRAGVRVVLGRHAIGTGFGSTIAGALVIFGAGAAGVSAVVIYVSVATGIVLGGWAGHAISKRRSHRLDADVLRRRSHTLRLLRVTRVLRRRNVA